MNDMACTTILAGKKATCDGATMIARNDDNPNGTFTVKKYRVVSPEEQPRLYKSVLSHVEIPLPDNPMRYTCTPNADPSIKGVWAAAGINEANVAMTATETITSNVRVLGADPLVEYEPAHDGQPEKAGGIGEEDIVVLVLPYIRSAREGVKRLGALLEEYGTYEMNGIAFADRDEVWYLETVGGHHWIASLLPDTCYAVLPNSFGEDNFHLEDALSNQERFMCSPDLKTFIDENHLTLTDNGVFNPRLAFGSHSDSDHVYNTPRMWYGQRYFNPTTVKWDGEDAQFSPLSDNMPWYRKPEHLITIDDVKYVLSSTFQGTKYDSYGSSSTAKLFRPIGINRTSFLSVAAIRDDVPESACAVEWFTYGCNVYNALVPQFTNVRRTPDYFANTTLEVSTDNFYWTNRLIGALADPHHAQTIIHIERYQESVGGKGRALVNEALRHVHEHEDDVQTYLESINQRIADMVKKETLKLLNDVLYTSSMNMKNSFMRSDQ